jgi:hypothetical protein
VCGDSVGVGEQFVAGQRGRDLGVGGAHKRPLRR